MKFVEVITTTNRYIDYSLSEIVLRSRNKILVQCQTGAANAEALHDHMQS